MQMKKNHVILHPIVLNQQVYMMLWKMRWYDIISGERTIDPKTKKSMKKNAKICWMVENSWIHPMLGL
jgi:hypothetical protein